MNKDSEKYLEPYLRDEIKKLGGRAFKFTSPGEDYMPDRIIFIKGLTFLCEVKSWPKKPSKMQLWRMRQLTSLGQTCDWINNKVDMDLYIQKITHAI